MARRVHPITVLRLAVLGIAAIAVGLYPLLAVLGSAPSAASAQPELLSTIAFASTRDNSTIDPRVGIEIYLLRMDQTGHPIGTPERLTDNLFGDVFPSLSPDGKRIVFDSNRLRTSGEPVNTSDLFVMKNDGQDLIHLVRGSSATWSPDGRRIAYHASASGTGRPIRSDPGAPTIDSDLFVLNVGDVVEDGAPPSNLTNSPAFRDEDADWSPDGQMIVYTRHPLTDPRDTPTNVRSAEVYLLRVDPQGRPLPDDPTQAEGSPQRNPQRLTFNEEEERGPTWSPDGNRILYICRRDTPLFTLCVLDKNRDDLGMWDGTWQTEKHLTTSGQYLTPTWSLDGKQILFHRGIPGPTNPSQLVVLTLNDAGTCTPPTPSPTATSTLTPSATSTPTSCPEEQITFPPGLNGYANWGQLRREGPPATVPPTRTATVTPSPTGTNTLTPLASSTPTPAATSTPSATPTATPGM